MSRMMLVALAALFAVGPAVAQTPPDPEWAGFIENSMARYRDARDASGWEEQLYAAGEAGRSRSRAVAEFGRAVAVPLEAAQRYAAAIIRSTGLRETCDGQPCRLRPGDAGYDETVGVAMTEPSGALMLSVGKTLAVSRSAVDIAAYLADVQRHPQRLVILEGMYAYSEDRPFVTLMILDAPEDPRTVAAAAAIEAEADGGPDHWNGWFLAALEQAAEAEARAPTPIRAAYAQAALLEALNLGLTDRAVEQWAQSPDELRLALPLTAGRPCTDDDRPACAARAAAESFTDEMSAALWTAGQEDEARSLLERGAARLGQTKDWSAPQRHAAVLDAIERRLRPADLFDLFVDGDPALKDKEDSGGLSGSGWLFTSYGPAARALVGERAASAGYRSMADSMARHGLYYRQEGGGYQNTLAGLAGVMPAAVQGRQAELEALIEAAWARAPRDERAPPARTASGAVGWRETSLPAGVAAWDDHRERAALPADLDPPAPPESILRHEVVDGEHVILFESSEFDLPGEIPAYGVWLARTEHGVWTDPVYLGLQQHFPYVVAAGSAVPLIQDGMLRIEVQVRQIDPRSITFPPVGLTVSRSEDGVVLEARLEDIVGDSDGDGLTDMAERRLGLDPNNPDGDGDGRLDGVDSQPLTAFDPSAGAGDVALAGEILKQVAGYDAEAHVIQPDPGGEEGLDVARAIGAPSRAARMRTMILVGDPALFAGVDLPFRLMVYTPEQAAHLNPSGAPFYPPKIDVFSSLDGLNHFVVWSASWVGGQFSVRCEAGGTACKSEVKSQWIT